MRRDMGRNRSSNSSSSNSSGRNLRNLRGHCLLMDAGGELGQESLQVDIVWEIA